MAAHPMLVLGLLYFAKFCEAAQYPTNVVNFRDESTPLGFADAPIRLVGAERLVVFNQSHKDPKKYFEVHINFGDVNPYPLNKWSHEARNCDPGKFVYVIAIMQN